MRIILFAIFYVISLNGIYAQCEVDAGVTRNVCGGEEVTLSGSIISGDIERTAWQMNYFYEGLDRTFHASDVLNDTTILTPIVTRLGVNTLRFYLTGYTSNDSTCIDSVDYNFSHFVWALLDKSTFKERSDTFQLFKYIDASWGISNYEWSPNFMISDTTVEMPFVWNDTTTYYNLEVTDSIGCKAVDDVFEVHVNSTSIDNNYQSVHIKLFPNPAIEEINIVSDERIIETYLYNMKGQLFKISNNDKVDISSFPKGEYIAISKMEDGKLVGRSFIKL
jgi:hypothetical protein